MKETDQLDPVEARMLALLQKDAGLSTAQLAEATHSSPATCWRRLKSLEERGILGPPVRLVDPARVGRGMDAFVQIRMKSQDSRSRALFQRTMELEPAIIEVYSISGEWDYLLHLVVRDIADLEEVLMRRVLELDCVAGSSTLFALRRVKHTTEIPV
ncbi:Lrp/AsnC family transcriptional regulator [Pseudoponticoccus marisrubri]|uniref:AsnC family transcriptional regulator n=1 Tax=Pseudoponticoccus marisrubri TaxID=1685382 RepID=A0A0W7WJX5_9RHOB|nr:Lrp/AsnC family transcriptional regulator [Pseudoponticoccus marisrubri]KUF10914.1 AsnC family transcriptional regulator [Pseudoponticoccus marisrubri]